jgi:hypothetical protein
MHCVSVIKTNQLMLYEEIFAVCSEIHTEHINALCGQNVRTGGITRLYPLGLKGLDTIRVQLAK